MICFHRWTKWEVKHEGVLHTRKWVGINPVMYPIGTRLVQRRECEKCGKVQIDQKDIY
jgi:hypothetical protein